VGNFDLESGKRLIAEGDLVEGLRCLLASIDQDPGDPAAYVELWKAYEAAWHESGDPLVLDQMRKVAVAGLKRGPDPLQERFLRDALDRSDALLAAVQQAEQEAEQQAEQEESRRTRLPVIRNDD